MASSTARWRAFDAVNPQPDYAQLEQQVLDFWQRERIFARTSSREAPKGEYVFFEGPPTANGRPALHHVLARAFKDLFPRHRVMKGYHVTRKGGWDTHGLPVEIAVEKQLGLRGRSHDRSREELEEFNRLCRESVFQNIKDWNYFTERLGFWVDLEHAYVTYHDSYIESVWNLLKRMWDKGLVEQDYKVVPLAPSIATTLSAAEIADGYRDVDDPSVYVRCPLKPEAAPPKVLAALSAQGVDRSALEGAALLVWTTTPWTLPSNVAVAANPELEYVLAASSSGPLVIAAEAVERVSALHEPLTVLARFKGSDLERWRYTPPFPEVFPELGVTDEAHYVVLAEYVSAEDGTGLVHQSPAYGADDLLVARQYGLPLVFGVDSSGTLKVTSERGKFFKDADKGLTRILRERGLLYWGGTYRHAYPFYTRTDEPVLYFARPSWYVRTQRLRDRMVEENQKINWVPNHIKNGRFGNWLETNVDWAISRERYWGTPLPFWRAEDGSETICIGSVQELSMLAGRDLSHMDLHRPYVDDVTFQRNGLTYRRVPEVLDVWFDSGSMPYAQWHLVLSDGEPLDPEGARQFEKHYPADFICEAIDQTRGWFYSLHAISVALYDQPSYKNVVCLGHIVDEHGRKMSKSLGNVVEPLPLFDKYGADSVRWYMYTASEPGDSKRFSERLVAEGQRGFINTLWNVYAFFVLYANLDRPQLADAPDVSDRPEIDRWLLARLTGVVRSVDQALEDYDARGAGKALESFVDELSNWYVRRNRRRFWKSGDDADKLAAYATLHEALVTVAKLAAPFTPFLAEAIYQNLELKLRPDAADSVHLAAFPEFDPARYDEALVHEMEVVQRVVDLGRAARGQGGLKTRQPLPELVFRTRDPRDGEAVLKHADQVAEELNVKTVTQLPEGTDLVTYSLKPNLPTLGRKHGKLIPVIRQALASTDAAAVAHAVREGRNFTLDTSAGPLELAPEDVLVDASSPTGYAALEADGYLVALDTTVTPELAREGVARDLVRAVQQARKDAGLDVSDEIDLRLDLNGDMLDAARAHEDYIRAETLARTLEYAPATEGAFSAGLEEGGSISLSKAK